MGTVIQSDDNTTKNWRIAQRLLKDCAYSYNPGLVNEYSLDTVLTNKVYLYLGKYSAESVINVIGEVAFKKMIEYLWTPSLYNWDIGRAPYGIPSLANTFKWEETEEGHIYWQGIRRKLSRVFAANEFYPG